MNGGIMKPFGAAAIAAALLFMPISALLAEDRQATQAMSPMAEAPAEVVPSAAQSSPFLPGEQTIGLSVGLHIPALMYFPPSNTSGNLGNLYLGGSFSFSYQYFIERCLAIGGSIAGAFNNTIGSNTVFTAPLGFTTSYWWSAMPLEFSVLAEAGGYLSRYADEGMLGLFAKVGGGAYWRIAPGWSVGLQAYYWFVPELHVNPYTSLDALAGYVETSLGAVYHL
jgi:hypothetical protein